VHKDMIKNAESDVVNVNIHIYHRLSVSVLFLISPRHPFFRGVRAQQIPWQLSLPQPWIGDLLFPHVCVHCSLSLQVALRLCSYRYVECVISSHIVLEAFVVPESIPSTFAPRAYKVS
jgi:hypothetical protein